MYLRNLLTQCLTAFILFANGVAHATPLITGNDEPAKELTLTDDDSCCEVFYANGRLSISGLDDTKSPIRLSVYTMSGQCILQTEIDRYSPYTDIDLPKGFYIVRLDGEVELTERIRN